MDEVDKPIIQVKEAERSLIIIVTSDQLEGYGAIYVFLLNGGCIMIALLFAEVASTIWM